MSPESDSPTPARSPVDPAPPCSARPPRQPGSTRFGRLSMSCTRRDTSRPTRTLDGKMPGSGDNPIPDPLVWLAFVAATTTELGLVTGISLLPERHPVTYAKEVATLDNLSGGRLQLGIGIGWLKEEFEVLGVPWERRAARTEEYVEVMRALWAADNASFDGEFVTFDGMSSNPKPANGSVPIRSAATAVPPPSVPAAWATASSRRRATWPNSPRSPAPPPRSTAEMAPPSTSPASIPDSLARTWQEQWKKPPLGARPSGRALVHVLPEPRGVDRSDGREDRPVRRLTLRQFAGRRSGRSDPSPQAANAAL